MTEIQSKALAKLISQSKAIGGYGGVPVLAIYHHLRDAVKTSEELAAAMLPEAKTLKGCFDYVLKQMENRVLERSGQQCVCATEAETYQIAEDYWRKSDDEIKAEQDAADKAFKLAQEKKRAADAEKRKADEAKRKADAAEKKKDEKPAAKKEAPKAKKDAPAPKAKPPKPAEEKPDQLSWFGGEGEPA